MKYRNIQTAVFIARPNRFIAEVEVDGKTETVHVKNTGRCRELLLPGCKVILEKPDNPERKTNNVSYDNGLIPSYVQYRSEKKNKSQKRCIKRFTNGGEDSIYGYVYALKRF